MPSLSLKNSVIAACECMLCQIHLWRLNSKILNLQVKGNYEAQFRVIGVLPDQEVDDVFNHGLYEQTKKRITDAASDNGYFDSYWRLHDVKVAQPQNTADINLRYETGERYKLGNVEFRMSDPIEKFPLDMDILQSMVDLAGQC